MLSVDTKKTSPADAFRRLIWTWTQKHFDSVPLAWWVCYDFSLTTHCQEEFTHILKHEELWQWTPFLIPRKKTLPLKHLYWLRGVVSSHATPVNTNKNAICRNTWTQLESKGKNSHEHDMMSSAWLRHWNVNITNSLLAWAWLNTDVALQRMEGISRQSQRR